MSKHVTYKGATIDMDSMRRENEKTVAIGNMKVNARGDQINRGMVTKTADEIARENHRVQSAVVSSGLKGAPPSAVGVSLDTPKTPVKQKTEKKTKEVELPSGDIVIKDDNGE